MYKRKTTKRFSTPYVKKTIKDKDVKVDMSYKLDEWIVDYDFESTRNLFSNALISNDSLTFMLYGDEQFDKIPDEYFIDKMKDFVRDNQYYLKKEPSEYTYHFLRYKINDDESMSRLYKDLSSISMSKLLDCEKEMFEKLYPDKKVPQASYRGWNSSYYDLLLVNTIKCVMARKNKKHITPSEIRDISNLIIRYVGPPFKMEEYMVYELNKMGMDVTLRDLSFANKLSIWTDGHVDYAKLIKANADDNKGDSDGSTVIAPSLKKLMARFGLDVIVDESVTEDDSKIWSQEDLDELVDYDFNDVLGSRVCGSKMQHQLKIRDMVRERYPWTSARFVPLNMIEKSRMLERDATSANIVAAVLVGPNKNKPIDYEYVKYDFPIPDGKGGTKIVNFLDYVIEKEKFMHPRQIEFFRHFEGKDTRTKEQNYIAKITQPVTKQAVVRIPYYRNGKPLDTCIDTSTGGSHGTIVAGLSKMSEEEIDLWIRTMPKLKENQKPTIDTTYVLDIDYESFYPTLATKMKMYMTSDGIDRYTMILDERLSIKSQLPDDKSLWDEFLKYLDSIQDGLKFVLNNATGAGNQHKEFALLPLDNKTLSMRLIGNMAIFVLGQRLVHAGAFILATNTDGLYICNMTKEKSLEVIEEFIKDYGLPVKPKKLSRFVNRDTSNRFKYVDGHLQDVKGRVTHGEKLEYSPYKMDKSVSYPLIAANAMLHYMSTKENWLYEPYDRNYLKEYILEKAKDGNNRMAFAYIFSGTKSSKLLLDGQKHKKVSRMMITKEGKQVEGYNRKEIVKTQMCNLWNQFVMGTTNSKDLIFEDGELEGDLAKGITLSYNNFQWRNKERDYTNNKDKKKIYIYDKPVNYKFENWLMSDSFLASCKNKNIYSNDDLAKKFAMELHPYFRTHSEDEFNKERVINGPHYKDFINGALFITSNPDLGLCVVDDTKQECRAISRWSKGKITGFNGEKVIVVDKRQDLLDFDMEQLDIDAYVQWAEDFLKTWKVTANIEELNMTKSPYDMVDEKVKRLSKKDLSQNILIDMYESIYESIKKQNDNE